MAMKAACHRVSRTVMHMRMSVTLSADEQRQRPGKGNRGPGSLIVSSEISEQQLIWSRGVGSKGPAGLRW